MCKNSCSNAVSPCPTKPSANGVGSLGRTTPIGCVGVVLSLGKWHLDEVFLTINGKRHYLWRAVDQDDNVLDILVQSRRNKQAAKKFFRKLLKGCSTCHVSS